MPGGERYVLGAGQGGLDCCSFNRTELEQYGGWDSGNGGDGRKDGNTASRVSQGSDGARNSKACVQACLTQFLGPAQWNQNMSAVCHYLEATQAAAESVFWPLYWCDSTYCGVWANQTGEDPNVDLIINTCQNIGYASIQDLGPPSKGFVCDAKLSACTNLDIPREHSTLVGGAAITLSPSMLQSTTSVSSDVMTSSAPSNSVVPTDRSDDAVATHTSWSSSSSMLPAVTSPAHQNPTPYGTAILQTPGPQSPSTASSTAGGQLSEGAKAAIAICSTLAVVALLIAALIMLHRGQQRRKPGGDSDHGPRQSASSSFLGPSGQLRSHVRLTSGVALSRSATEWPHPLLMSPMHAAGPSHTVTLHQGSHDTRDGPLLTPPLRLRDRRLLPSIFLGGGGRNRSGLPSPPLTPLTTAEEEHVLFPSSPIYSPTTSKLVPRRERTSRLHSHHNSHGNGSHGSASTHLSGNMLPRLPPPVAFSFPRPDNDAPTPRNALATGPGPFPPPLRTSQSSLAASSAYSSLRHGSTEMALPVSALSGPTATPPGSPRRPPRPHEEPLEIPGLVTPARGVGIGMTTPTATATPMPSPPPTKALPLLPSMLFPLPLAVGSEAGLPVAAMAAPNLADQTRDQEQPERSSWGNWTGAQGRAPGALVPKAGQGRARAVSPMAAGQAEGGTCEHHDVPASATVSVLHEEDLESFGGTY